MRINHRDGPALGAGMMAGPAAEGGMAAAPEKAMVMGGGAAGVGALGANVGTGGAAMVWAGDAKAGGGGKTGWDGDVSGGMKDLDTMVAGGELSARGAGGEADPACGRLPPGVGWGPH